MTVICKLAFGLLFRHLTKQKYSHKPVNDNAIPVLKKQKKSVY